MLRQIGDAIQSLVSLQNEITEMALNKQLNCDFILAKIRSRLKKETKLTALLTSIGLEDSGPLEFNPFIKEPINDERKLERMKEILADAIALLNVAKRIPSNLAEELIKSSSTLNGVLEVLWRVMYSSQIPEKPELEVAKTAPAKLQQSTQSPQQGASAIRAVDQLSSRNIDIDSAIESLVTTQEHIQEVLLNQTLNYSPVFIQIWERFRTQKGLITFLESIGLVNDGPPAFNPFLKEPKDDRRKLERMNEILAGAIKLLNDLKKSSPQEAKTLIGISREREGTLGTLWFMMSSGQVPERLDRVTEPAPVSQPAQLQQSSQSDVTQEAVQAVIDSLNQLRAKLPNMLSESNKDYDVCARNICAELHREFIEGSINQLNFLLELRLPPTLLRPLPDDKLAKRKRQVHRALEIIDDALEVLNDIKLKPLEEIKKALLSAGSWGLLGVTAANQQIPERQDRLEAEQRRAIPAQEERKETRQEQKVEQPPSQEALVVKAIGATIQFLKEFRNDISLMPARFNYDYDTCVIVIFNTLFMNHTTGALSKLNSLLSLKRPNYAKVNDGQLAKGERQVVRAREIIDGAVTVLEELQKQPFNLAYIKDRLSAGRFLLFATAVTNQQIVEHPEYLAQQKRAIPAQEERKEPRQEQKIEQPKREDKKELPRESVMGPPAIRPGEHLGDILSSHTVVYFPDEQVEQLRASILRTGPGTLSAFSGQNTLNNIEHARRFLAAFTINPSTSAGDCRKFVETQITWRNQLGANYPLLKEAALFSPQAALQLCVTRFCQHFSVKDILEIYRAHQDNDEYGPQIKRALTALRPSLNVDVINKEEVTCSLTGEVFRNPVQVTGEDKYGNLRAFYFERDDIIRRIREGDGCIENPFSIGHYILEDLLESAPEMEKKLVQYNDASLKPAEKKEKVAVKAEEKKAEPVEELIEEDDICCPITLDPFVDPVKVIEKDEKTGKISVFYFERAVILDVIKKGNGTAPNPKTRAPITAAMLQEAPEMVEKVRKYEEQQAARLGR